MHSTRGRPRQITDAQIEAILAWHRTYKPMRVFAQEMGMEKSTIYYVIKHYAELKQPSPENRELALSQRQRRRQQLRAGGWR